jgi:hypothetical protein
VKEEHEHNKMQMKNAKMQQEKKRWSPSLSSSLLYFWKKVKNVIIRV